MNRFSTIFVLLLFISFSVSAAPKKAKNAKKVETESYAEVFARAQNNYLTYNLDAASDDIDKCEEILDKQKKDYPQALDDMRDRIIMARNMLERVEKIEIVDTLHVDSLEFFQYYRLAPDAGMIMEAEILPAQYLDSIAPRLVYSPESGKELLWGMRFADGTTSLAMADVLDDGTVDTPRIFGKDLSEGNTDFPFMLQDGATIYFGAEGEDSLGGYDIFMTRRDEDGNMLNPQNIGMPYNSPYNDYMFAIDETNNLGWWASDRDKLPGMVTIYVFVPSKMRVNYESNNENIIHYALLDAPELTGDIDSHISELALVDDDPEFYFPMGNGKVYTRLDQFRNTKARQAMTNYLNREADYEVTLAKLENLRARYAAGDKSVSTEILKLERSLKETVTALKRASNQVISRENK